MRTIIVEGTLVTPQQTLQDHSLIVEDGTVVALVPGRPQIGGDDRVIEAAGRFVIPGMIDVHVHGSAGQDTMDATQGAIHGMARFLAQHGVTAYLPTTITAPRDTTGKAIENVAGCPQPENGARHLGVHLEGPYLNAEYKGAQPAAHLRPPDEAEYMAWLEKEVVRLITVAPELGGASALIEEGVKRGVAFAVGHSGASYEQVLAAVGRGLRQSTHTYNGMLGMHHRSPGTAGAVLSDDRIYAQVIADGVHVHPAMIDLLIRAKGWQRTILITDAIRAAGLEDGQYDLGGEAIAVENGIARTSEGNLAGSTLTMDGALRNVMAFAGLSLAQVVAMATYVPAEAIGLAGKKGVLAPGADADVVLLDEDLQVKLTMVGGTVAYQAPE